MEIPLLRDIVVLFSLSILVLLVCFRLKIPSIVGFLITGILAGPHGLGLVQKVKDVQLLSEIGIVLLLFTIGMEFSIKKIVQYKRFFLVSGFLQVTLTVLSVLGVCWFSGCDFNEALFLGFLISLSSTAIVMRLYNERAVANTPFAHLALGILIFQDVASIPMMLVIPIFGQGDIDAWPLLISLAKGIFLLSLVFVGASRLVPALLYRIAKTRSRELFLVSVFVICFAVAWIAATVGLSLSLGAFLAGLIVAESEYSDEAISDILPFQDLFVSFFFLSIGMLLDIRFFLDNPWTVLGTTFFVMCLKTFITTLSGLAAKMPFRSSLIAGLGLSQIGEFSFVIDKVGLEYGLGSTYSHQEFLSIALLSMALSPLLIAFAPKIADFVLKWPIFEKWKTGGMNQEAAGDISEGHTVIVGYGISGHNIAQSLKKRDIAYRILEMNPQTVRAERAKGEPIHFGDASHETVLHHVRLKHASVLAIVINDPTAASRIIKTARRLNPNLHIIVRARFVKEIAPLTAVGANVVIPDEWGASIAMFSNVLRAYNVEEHVIHESIQQLQQDVYV